MKLGPASLIFLAFVIGAGVAALLGVFDRDACLDAGGRWIAEQGKCAVPGGSEFVSVSRRVGVWITWAVMAAIALFLAGWAHYHRKVMRDRGLPARDVYVFVEDDGSARELSPDEQKYLATEFLPGDGAQPYIKSSYRQRTPNGHLSGFLARRDLPRRIAVKPAGRQDP